MYLIRGGEGVGGAGELSVTAHTHTRVVVIMQLPLSIDLSEHNCTHSKSPRCVDHYKSRKMKLEILFTDVWADWFWLPDCSMNGSMKKYLLKTFPAVSISLRLKSLFDMQWIWITTSIPSVHHSIMSCIIPVCGWQESACPLHWHCLKVKNKCILLVILLLQNGESTLYIQYATSASRPKKFLTRQTLVSQAFSGVFGSLIRAGHFRYFLIFSIIKNDCLHFYQVKLTGNGLFK